MRCAIDLSFNPRIADDCNWRLRSGESESGWVVTDQRVIKSAKQDELPVLSVVVLDQPNTSLRFEHGIRETWIEVFAQIARSPKVFNEVDPGFRTSGRDR